MFLLAGEARNRLLFGMNGEQFSAAIEEIRKETDTRIAAVDPELFFRKPAQGWSLAENIKHLIKVNRIAGFSLAAPVKWTLIFTGSVKRPVRDTDTFVRDYKKVMQSGFPAGFFKPGTAGPKNNSSWQEYEKIRLIKKWNSSAAYLAGCVKPWTEKRLTKTKILQPSLGWVPAAEMIASLILHIEHHLTVAGNRLSIPLAPETYSRLKPILG